jgi:transcriptional regulator with XRE-family HTH domain
MRNLIKMLKGNPIQKKNDEILIRIKEERVKKKLSQYVMGEKLGISQNAYYKMEKGHTKLDLQRLIQLSYILDVKLSKLVS